MYNVSTVQQGLKNVVGFRQPTDPGMKKIDSDLVTSSSGLYFQDVHALIKLETLHSVKPNFEEYVFNPYNVSTTYAIGDYVSSGTDVYKSLVSSNIGNAVSSNAHWKLTDLFSEWLTDLKLSGINKVIAKTIEAKKLRKEVKTIFENLDLYQGWGRTDNLEIKTGRFIFFQIEVKHAHNLTVSIDSVSTQLSQVQGDLDIYVYNEKNYTPEIITVTLTKQYSFEKTTTSIVLQPGLNYVGYYEDDLVGQAIKKLDYAWNSAPCGSCSTYNPNAYKNWSKYVKVSPGYVAASNVDGDKNIWDLTKNVYDYNNNFGLNFGLSVRCDLSNFIVENKNMFANAIALQVAVDVMQEIGNSIRNNSITEQTRKLALFALDNRENGSIGLAKQLEKSINALDFDMSSLGECLPCKEARGIRTVAI